MRRASFATPKLKIKKVLRAGTKYVIRNKRMYLVKKEKFINKYPPLLIFMLDNPLKNLY